MNCDEPVLQPQMQNEQYVIVVNHGQLSSMLYGCPNKPHEEGMRSDREKGEKRCLRAYTTVEKQETGALELIQNTPQQDRLLGLSDRTDFSRF